LEGKALDSYGMQRKGRDPTDGTSRRLDFLPEEEFALEKIGFWIFSLILPVESKCLDRKSTVKIARTIKY